MSARYGPITDTTVVYTDASVGPDGAAAIAALALPSGTQAALTLPDPPWRPWRAEAAAVAVGVKIAQSHLATAAASTAIVFNDNTHAVAHTQEPPGLLVLWLPRRSDPPSRHVDELARRTRHTGRQLLWDLPLSAPAGLTWPQLQRAAAASPRRDESAAPSPA